MDWMKFSFVCLALGILSLGVVTLVFLTWATTTPDVGWDTILPSWIKVVMVVPLTFGFGGVAGFLMHCFKEAP